MVEMRIWCEIFYINSSIKIKKKRQDLFLFCPLFLGLKGKGRGTEPSTRKKLKKAERNRFRAEIERGNHALA